MGKKWGNGDMGLVMGNRVEKRPGYRSGSINRNLNDFVLSYAQKTTSFYALYIITSFENLST